MKARDQPVLILQQDNAGENKALHDQMTSVDWKLDVVVEYTERDTLQKNALAEQAFVDIARKTCALMNAANIPKKWKWILFPEAAMTVTKLDQLQVIDINGVEKARIKHFGYPLPGFLKHLHTWGEAGTIKLAKQNKVENYGLTCIFVGYANHHESICN